MTLDTGIIARRCRESDFPESLAHLKNLFDKLANSVAAKFYWNDEHQTLILRRSDSGEIHFHTGMLFEVEVYRSRSKRFMICWTLVDNATTTYMTFTSSKPNILTRFLLLKVVRIANRPACSSRFQRMIKQEKNRKNKYTLSNLLVRGTEYSELTVEEREWLDMPPIGREII